MLGDFDADGDLDVLSGSYPGELYLFRRNADGSFADGETLKDRDGNAIKADKASTVFLADWDADGDLDMVLGSIRGDVYLVINEGAAKAPEFGKPVKLDLDLAGSNSGPIVADWDGDGLADLLVGLSDGSAHWLRNVGTAEKPKFASSETLVEKSGFGFRFEDRKPGQWGARVKLCATDFNGDGRLDLLLGDRSGDVVEPEMTDEQRQAYDKAKQQMAELMKQRAEASAKLIKLQRESRNAEKPATDEDRQRAKERASELQELVKGLQKLNTEYAACSQKLREFGPQKVRHGFVWFFQRKPKAE
ncbi:MAG: VCBS repeat-containing protein [Planctomycetes bacterium]|nr:VCBS repeat-containing protein [Planctomycetota bacterium]MBL7037343.1 VCBS repeat-containing protein [Pirellulaceae bacterium]